MLVLPVLPVLLPFGLGDSSAPDGCPPAATYRCCSIVEASTEARMQASDENIAGDIFPGFTVPAPCKRALANATEYPKGETRSSPPAVDVDRAAISLMLWANVPT